MGGGLGFCSWTRSRKCGLLIAMDGGGGCWEGARQCRACFLDPWLTDLVQPTGKEVGQNGSLLEVRALARKAISRPVTLRRASPIVDSYKLMQGPNHSIMVALPNPDRIFSDWCPPHSFSFDLRASDALLFFRVSYFLKSAARNTTNFLIGPQPLLIQEAGTTS